MIDRHPDMLAVDADGRARGFGSRRHYCFSHDGYRAEAIRITEALADRYGHHPGLGAWQTDNEYACHDTVLSYSDAARRAFRDWLAQRYQSTDALNRAWGNVFWSMEYDSFDQIDLPNLTVTEPNPSHALDFRRFSSDQVARFNAGQVAAIRARSDAPISHNYMGRVLDFDHFALGTEMEIATWDSYPLGFLEDRLEDPDEHKRRYARQGDPDFQAFHHDLYRAVGHGRWWVMEQQPGPVNWAPHNPAPLPGMVRFWTWEAFAHGAECVSYFRWRQAPFAQEQYHAGLLRPDSVEAPAFGRRGRWRANWRNCRRWRRRARRSRWCSTTRPPGPGRCSRRARDAIISGWSSRFIAGCGNLACRSISCRRTLPILAATAGAGPRPRDAVGALLNAIARTEAQVILGPRTGAKTAALSIPVPLPPAIPGLDITVARVETMRPDMPVPVKQGGHVTLWREDLEGSATVLDEDVEGRPVTVRSGNLTYLGGWPDPMLLRHILLRACSDAGVATRDLPPDIRIRQAGGTRFVFNHGPDPVEFEGRVLPPAGVIW
jgi:beta-galactosidase